MADLTLRAQCELAAQHLQDGQPQQAAEVCRRILAVFPKHVATYGILGQACMQMGQHEDAANLFRRVLGADPENTLGYVGLGAIYAERGLWDEALWQFRRASELSPGNREIRAELLALSARFGLAPDDRLEMTRAALARTYLRGQLYPKAAGELRELVQEQAERFDLRVALAEALWHCDKREDVQAVCQGILGVLPNCVKANLILGQMLLNTEQDEEGRRLLSVAQRMDPENAVAQRLMGARSPLPPRIVRLPSRAEDNPPPDLPYLLADDAPELPVETQDVLVESLRSEKDDPELAGTTVQGTADSESVAAPADQKPTDQRAPSRGIGLLDVEMRYVHANPDDAEARLSLARKLCNVGQVPLALEHYRYLAMADYASLAAVLRDLDLLHRLYPDVPEIVELVVDAQDRASQKPAL